ncbi:hypothetical protein CCR94_12240 [Rhodoblastus sphagnicola]|uniref:Uncharacterized protein n=1 Tax=Rhodoblastus sphagnicola TaxID=333368 RepID=A0A2S6N7C8_9HYPH|nr:hypothetical protein [Rhodoblastus sphagnicola]MBB4196910.1 hypothetical protein [Rhodoblastus sphagnicola]PPQ30518.1 hypothetical protein CCR94_12240 [Rhodoblastus sphagnicola]
MISFRSHRFASLALLAALAPSLARAADIALDNVSLPTSDVSKLTFKHIEFKDANISAEEATKLFSGALPRDAVADMLGKLKAARVTANEAVMTSDKPGSVVFRDFNGEGVDQGAIAHLSLGGIDADIPGDTGGSAVTLKSQAVTIDGVRIQHLAEAIRSGEPAAISVRITHAAWSGFDMSTPDKNTPAGADGGNLIRIHLNSAEAEQSFDGDAPGKSSFVANGLSIAMPKASQAGATLTALGYDKVEATLKFSGAYQAANRTFTLDDYSIDFAKLGSIGLSGRFGGIDKAAFGSDVAARTAAVQAAEVQALTLKLVNAGALDKAVALTALSKNQAPDAVRAEWSMIAAQAPMLAPNIPAAATLSRGLLKFIANGKSLTLALAAKAPAPKLAELQEMKDPALISARFDVTAEADGAAPPLAAPISAPASAQMTAPPPAPAPNAPAQKLTGAAAWGALVGNTITGKDSDGLPLSEFYAPSGAVKQLDDDETATGKWILRGENVCFIFPGEKQETCYKLEVAGDVATFIDEDGDGKRYTILKGNAKNL